MGYERIMEVYKSTNSIEETYEALKDTEFKGLTFEEFKKAIEENKSKNELSDEELEEVAAGVKILGSDVGIFCYGKWEKFNKESYCNNCKRYVYFESRMAFYIVGAAEEIRCSNCRTLQKFREQHIHGHGGIPHSW